MKTLQISARTHSATSLVSHVRFSFQITSQHEIFSMDGFYSQRALFHKTSVTLFRWGLGESCKARAEQLARHKSALHATVGTPTCDTYRNTHPMTNDAIMNIIIIIFPKNYTNKMLTSGRSAQKSSHFIPLPLHAFKRPPCWYR